MGRCVVKFIRTMHRYGFRSGKWALLKGTITDPQTGRECYLVEFADGMADFWVVNDPDGQYEFSDGAAMYGELT